MKGTILSEREEMFGDGEGVYVHPCILVKWGGRMRMTTDDQAPGDIGVDQ
jgi:hypothetical protein